MSSLFFQSEIVTILPSGSVSGQVVIPTLQSVGLDINVQRNDVSRLGRFAPMPFRQAYQFPIIPVQLEYIPTGTNVETALGLMGANSVLDNLVVNSQYGHSTIKIQGREMIYNDGNGDNYFNFTVTSGVLTNYSFQASVGQTPRVSISLEGVDIGATIDSFSPPTPSDQNPTLRPNDISISFPTGIFIADEFYEQSVSLTIPLQRTNLYKLGDQKPFSRKIQAPIIANAQITAIASSFKATTSIENSDEMKNLVCGKRIDGDMLIKVYSPVCTGNYTSEIVNFVIKKPYIDSINIGNSVGNYTTITMNFSIPISPVGNNYGYTADESNLIISGNTI